ncbi:MAG: hypothetical protein ACI3U2_07485 [Anaerovibrio sp.]
MSDIDELYIKAKEKLEAESFQHGTPEDAIRSMCLEWLEWAVANDTKAVELLADAAKDTKGAYNAMENLARKNRGSGTCVKLEPLEAMACIMEYYGIGKDKAHQQLESGLMYHLMVAECKKYKPYGVDEQVADTAPTPEPAKATPVTDLQPKMQYEKPQIIEEPTPFSFDDFDSELEGLL